MSCLCRAFDAVLHHILILKLESCGFKSRFTANKVEVFHNILLHVNSEGSLEYML